MSVILRGVLDHHKQQQEAAEKAAFKAAAALQAAELSMAGSAALVLQATQSTGGTGTRQAALGAWLC